MLWEEGKEGRVEREQKGEGEEELFRGGREGVKKSRRHGAIHTIDNQPSTW